MSFDREVGEYVEMDEIVVTIESDKGDNPMRTPEAGTIKEFLVEEGETVEIGQEIFVIDTEGKAASNDEASTKEETKEATKEEKKPE